MLIDFNSFCYNCPWRASRPNGSAYEVSILLGFFVSVHALAGHCDVDIPEKVKRHFVEEKE